MILSRRKFVLVGAAALSAGTGAGLAQDAYPSRAIRVIVGFTPGAAADVAARVLSQGVGPILGEQLVVAALIGPAQVLGRMMMVRIPFRHPVSVALPVYGVMTLGMVAFALGHGAWLSSGALDWRGEDTASPVRLACNRDVPLAQALVATGFGYAAGRRQVQGDVLRAVLPRVRDIRRFGSAAAILVRSLRQFCSGSRAAQGSRLPGFPRPHCARSSSIPFPATCASWRTCWSAH